MDDKRAKGLYFFCDEKYEIGHKCKSRKQLYMVEVCEEEMTTTIEVEEEVLIQEVVEPGNEFMTISLQAFTSVSGYQTIRVMGYHEKRPLQVFIDTGSTHKFIDQEVAKKLGCQFSSIVEQSISVADGRKVQTAAVCKNLQWLLQGTTFSSNFLLLPLENVDIVLGVQWLSTLGRILFDFRNKTIEFVHQGKKHVLRGANNQWKSTKATSLPKLNDSEAQFFMMSLMDKDANGKQCHNYTSNTGGYTYTCFVCYYQAVLTYF
nr:uncharacterized protein LOC117278664 [Nicotiana tomentosiformis]